jgi:uncharacterized membrane protein
MNNFDKQEFISELKHKLRRLPDEEIENAAQYYEEFFEECSGGAEQYDSTVVEALGSPSAVAAKIIGEYAVNNAGIPREKHSKHPLLIAVLALCAAPIALPIALSVIILVLSLVIVFFSFMVSTGAITLWGIAATVLGLMTFSHGFSTGVFNIGIGLLTFALGAALTILSVQFMRFSFCGLQRWIGKLLIRRAAV